MPGPRLSKASLSNALSAVMDLGMTPRQLSVNADGTFTIDLGETLAEQPADRATEPKKWASRGVIK